LYPIPEDFYLGKYNFTINCREDVILSSFRGSTIRGALMSSLHDIICMQQQVSDCQKCMVKENCVFALLFNSFPPEDAEVLTNLDDIPRPYSIYISARQGRIFEPGDKLNFTLKLIGKNTDYIGHIAMAVKNLENEGLGGGRGKIELESITSKGENILDEKDGTIDKEKPLIYAGKFNREFEEKTRKIKMTLNSPLRLKYEDEYCEELEFHHIIRDLCRRFSTFARIYCDLELDWNFKKIITKAEQVEKLSADTQWIDKTRYSKSQDQELKIGGLLGEVKFAGEIGQFIPLLRLGEIMQSGKSTTFGFGKYELEVK